jgi:hypothetical protein
VFWWRWDFSAITDESGRPKRAGLRQQHPVRNKALTRTLAISSLLMVAAGLVVLAVRERYR